MYFTGFADEASPGIAGQIEATRQLGWHFIESRNIDNVNIHDLPGNQFEAVCEALAAAGVRINCFGSAVANWGWSPLSDDDFAKTRAQLERALVRMKRLDCTMLRGMSFKAQWQRPAFDPEVEKQVFAKVNTLVKMCEDAGVLYLHENCNNYGGMSWKHTLKLLDHVKSPAFKLVFDTGNPVFNYDRSHGDELKGMQNSWEFYSNVREFIHYVHIKDGHALGMQESGFAKAEYTFPGEGDGNVRRIIGDLIKNGYDGGFSIEPHMGSVFHEASGKMDTVKCTQIYVEYGRRFMKIVEEAKTAAGRL